LEKPIDVGNPPALSAGFVTFGSLNTFAKMTGDAIDLWARAMRQTPNSRLLLLGPAGATRRGFEHRMASHGIDSRRIEWLDRMPRPVYMEAYRRIDIVLDTFPCTGHTTTFDAIWMGTPVVTLAGKTAMSRGGLSVLSNLKLPDWIAYDAEEFVQKASKLATDLPRLLELRRSLRERIETSALMDQPRFARGMEAIYRRIWRTWCESR
jgi:predicted O-linked N-acetylglucosamine transferase (SPINDLY family)